jgi:hypothetical protein
MGLRREIKRDRETDRQQEGGVLVLGAAAWEWVGEGKI